MKVAWFRSSETSRSFASSLKDDSCAEHAPRRTAAMSRSLALARRIDEQLRLARRRTADLAWSYAVDYRNSDPMRSPAGFGVVVELMTENLWTRLTKSQAGRHLAACLKIHGSSQIALLVPRFADCATILSCSAALARPSASL
jgi:hypothetical protein